jgi:hypothetical protein
MQDKKGAGAYNRRVQILKPKTIPNKFNEKKTSFEVVYEKYPAKRLDAVSKADESLENHLIAGSSVVEWDLRYIRTLQIKTSWRIKDIFDGKTYEIIAPATEKGNGQGIRVLSKLIE